MVPKASKSQSTRGERPRNASTRPRRRELYGVQKKRRERLVCCWELALPRLSLSSPRLASRSPHGNVRERRTAKKERVSARVNLHASDGARARGLSGGRVRTREPVAGGTQTARAEECPGSDVTQIGSESRDRFGFAFSSLLSSPTLSVHTPTPQQTNSPATPAKV